MKSSTFSAPNSLDESVGRPVLSISSGHQVNLGKSLLLSAVTTAEPENAEAWAWQAAIHMVRADYAAARTACQALAPQTTLLTATACEAYVDSLTGAATQAASELGDALAKATPKDALSYDRTVDPGLSLEVTFPDGAKVSGALPGVTAKYMLEQDLEKKLANGTPVLFGKEPEAAPAAHTILFLGALMEDEKVMGPAKTMAEIDLVAVHTALPKKSGDKKCTGYKATNEQGPGREADLMLVDWDVSLIERKTAKVIEKKTFEAEKRCPMFAQGNETTSYPDRREIQTWLRSKR